VLDGIKAKMASFMATTNGVTSQSVLVELQEMLSCRSWKDPTSVFRLRGETFTIAGPLGEKGTRKQGRRIFQQRAMHSGTAGQHRSDCRNLRHALFFTEIWPRISSALRCDEQPGSDVTGAASGWPLLGGISLTSVEPKQVRNAGGVVPPLRHLDLGQEAGAVVWFPVSLNGGSGRRRQYWVF